MDHIENSIVFKFEGGMATEHELNFYELSRFQYAAARLIYKVEHYRLTGHLIERVTQKIETDIRVGTAKAGSWELSVLLDKIPYIASCNLKVPLGTLFAYIFGALKPKSKGKEIALEIARANAYVERQKTLQSEQETERMRIMAEVAALQTTTATQAIQVLKELSIEDKKLLRTKGIETEEQLRFLLEELKAEEHLEESLALHRDELSEISPEDMERLTEMFRKSASELALPLRSSAETMSIALSNKSETKEVCLFNEETLSNLAMDHTDERPTYLEGSIKSYDKETGWGKFRNEGLFVRPISFQVPAGLKRTTLSKISRAFNSRRMGATFYIVRNGAGHPIRLILENIVEINISES